MNIQTKLQRCITVLLAVTVLSGSFMPQLHSVAAATDTDTWKNMYTPCVEDTIVNAVESLWPSYFEVTDLTDGGIRLNWKNTNPEMVEGIAKALPLDGLTMQLDNLIVQDPNQCNIAFVMTNMGDWSVQMKNNQSVTLILNIAEGKLQAEFRNGFDANNEAAVEARQDDIIVSEHLKYEMIKGKPFQITLHKEKGSYRIDLDVGGIVLQGWLADGYFQNVTDAENVLVTLSPTQSSQTMSVDLKAIGPCFVWPENENRVISQIDNTVLPKNWVEMLEWEENANGLKLKWKNGAQDMRVGTATSLNLDGLSIEISDYNRPFSKGRGVPAFVIGSVQLPDTWDIYPIDEHTVNLTVTFDGNQLLARTKNQTHIIATDTALNPAYLIGKPVRLAFRAAENGDYAVNIKVGTWTATGTLPKSFLDTANGLTDQAQVYVSATVATPDASGVANASYVLNGIYNDAPADRYDLNGDGSENGVDLSLLRQALLNDDKNAKYDINGIDGVDILDLIHLKKYIAYLKTKEEERNWLEMVRKKYPITYWYNPKVMDEAAIQKMKEAGFTQIIADRSLEENKKIIKLCYDMGMEVLVCDGRITQAIQNPGERERLLRETVADYKDDINVYAYYITDEPSVDAFSELGEVCGILNQLDPAKQTYINLFPNYATSKCYGVESYTEYVESFIKTVMPELISYDHYDFQRRRMVLSPDQGITTTEPEQRTGFIDNIEAVRNISMKSGIPFMVIIQLVEHGGYRNVNEAELRWQVFQSLAYGSAKISYFTYGLPEGIYDDAESVWKYANSIVNGDGSPTRHYYEVLRINKELQTIGSYLLEKTPKDVCHIGTEENADVKYYEPSGDVEKIDTTAGLTLALYDSEILVANKSFTQTNRLEITVAASKTVSVMDKTTGEWYQLNPISGTKNSFTLTLMPGDGELIKIE